MCSIYFSNTTGILIDYEEVRKYYPFLLNLLFHSETQWVNINIIDALFPNVRHIEVRNVILCKMLLYFIVDDMKTDSVPSALKYIAICHGNISLSLPVKDVINKYTRIFRKMNMFICDKYGCQYNYCNKIRIYLHNKCEFALHLLDCVKDNIHLLDTNDEIIGLFYKWIKNSCFKNNVQFTEMKLNENQESFANYCVNKKELYLFWR